MRYIIYENSEQIGTAECEVSNTKLKINASCAPFDGIKRLRMIDKNGMSVSVTVMEPCGSKMVCSKLISLGELLSVGFSDISHFEIGEKLTLVNEEISWHTFTTPGFPIESCILDVCMKNKEKLLINDRIRAVAHRYDEKSELIFSLAIHFLNFISINGEKYVSICFNEDGLPKYCEDI